MRLTAQLLQLTPEEQRMVPKDPEFVGNVPVHNRLPGGSGEIVGSAKVENLHGKLIVHIDMAGKSADILREGFSLGEFSMKDDNGCP